jgi:hypothetical protein
MKKSKMAIAALVVACGLQLGACHKKPTVNQNEDSGGTADVAPASAASDAAPSAPGSGDVNPAVPGAAQSSDSGSPSSSSASATPPS